MDGGTLGLARKVVNTDGTANITVGQSTISTFRAGQSYIGQLPYERPGDPERDRGNIIFNRSNAL